MNKEKELKQYLERLEYFVYEISGLNRALLAAQNGMAFEEAMKKEVFIEDRTIRNHSWNALTIMIEHLLLLKMKYYTKDRKHGNWGDTIRNNRLRVIAYIGWDQKGRDVILIDYLSDALQDIYEAGVERYKKASEYYPNRVDRSQLIPEHCPWSLEELINDTVDELLEKLPDKEMGR